MNKVLWFKFKKGGLAIHCKTKKESEEFLRECSKNGINVSYYRQNSVISWEDNYKDKTCYDFTRGLGLTYCKIDYYFDREYTVLEWNYCKNANLLQSLNYKWGARYE